MRKRGDAPQPDRAWRAHTRPPPGAGSGTTLLPGADAHDAGSARSHRPSQTPETLVRAAAETGTQFGEGGTELFLLADALTVNVENPKVRKTNTEFSFDFACRPCILELARHGVLAHVCDCVCDMCVCDLPAASLWKLQSAAWDRSCPASPKHHCWV